MAEIIMPKMGDAMTEGKVVRWYKKAGDQVKKGEPVLEIETDKVNLDLEAEEDGVLSSVEVEEGKVAEVGATLATIGGASGKAKKSEEKPAEKPSKGEPAKAEPAKAKAEPPPAAQQPAEKPAAEAGQKQPGAAAQPSGGDGHVKSSPLARRMAKELGVELRAVQGSGPSGRVIAADIERAAKEGTSKAAPAAGTAPAPAARLQPAVRLEEKQIPLTAMRRTIAKRLVESIGPVPHFFLTMDIDVTELLRTRLQVNEISGAKVSVNDFIIRASALAIHHHPYVNSSFSDEAILQHADVSIGVAVATPEGLITPVVRNADGKSVVEISAEVRDLAERSKNRRLKPDEYQGATFTISNLGMFGIDEFTAIINPPNAAILAVGAAAPQPVVVDGQVVVRDRMKVTLSCDHRVIDGAAGAQFLQTLKLYLEQPLRLVM